MKPNAGELKFAGIFDVRWLCGAFSQENQDAGDSGRIFGIGHSGRVQHLYW